MTSEFLLHGHQELASPHYHFYSMGGAAALLGARGFAAAAGAGAGGLSLFFKGFATCQDAINDFGCAGAIDEYGQNLFCGIPNYCSTDCPCECSGTGCPPADDTGTGTDTGASAEVTFSMKADSLADAESEEGAIKAAIAGVGGVGEDAITVAFEAVSRRLLATGVYKARALARGHPHLQSAARFILAHHKMATADPPPLSPPAAQRPHASARRSPSPSPAQPLSSPSSPAAARLRGPRSSAPCRQRASSTWRARCSSRARAFPRLTWTSSSASPSASALAPSSSSPSSPSAASRSARVRALPVPPPPRPPLLLVQAAAAAALAPPPPLTKSSPPPNTRLMPLRRRCRHADRGRQHLLRHLLLQHQKVAAGLRRLACAAALRRGALHGARPNEPKIRQRPPRAIS